MKMLNMRHGRTRKDGSRAVVPILREKTRKYGQIISEGALSVRRDVMVTGAHASGKSRWIGKYVEHGASIWPNNPIVVLRAVNPLMSWYDIPLLHNHVSREKWKALTAYERSELLIEVVRIRQCVLLLDDAHKLTGRKADIALRCAVAARVVVTTASDEVRIPITLRLALMGRKPQFVRLESDAPYDITSIIVWLATLLSLGAGAWAIAALLGGFNMLGRGARASRNT
ncbi:MAG: hypothetical protein WAW41_06970 [Methylobacter sp.]